MGTVSSFAPIAAPDAHLLILGSMPGVRSLAAQQYDAHPKNAFWSILGAICGFTPTLPYAERTLALRARGIALWDVLQSCERAGSLDSAIVPASRQANDFASFFAKHPCIVTVLCNGGTAFTLFSREVVRDLPATFSRPRCVQMPSTSPAHAGMPFPDKLAAWRRIVMPLLGRPVRREC